MNRSLEKDRLFLSLQWLLFLAFFTSLICSFRVISSISTGLLLLSGLIQNRKGWRSLLRTRGRAIFLAGCLLLYLFDIVSLFYTKDRQQGWDSIRIKSALVFLPVAACLQPGDDRISRKKMLCLFCGLLALASLYCLGKAFLHFQSTHDASFFFYHQLVGPFRQNAIYFSVLLFIALVFLLESIGKKEFLFSRYFTISLAIYLSGFLFLLSSKLVIVFYGFYLLYYLIDHLRKRTIDRTIFIGSSLAILAASGLLLAVRNPVSERFYEIANGDMQLVRQDTFRKSDYFNGLQFRVLQWRFVGDILSRDHHWVRGVGVGDGQSWLNRQYIGRNIYAGDPVNGGQGYLAYNTHNQFLETVLQTGVTGLLTLLVTCVSLLRMAWEKRERGYSFILLLLLAWLFCESVFETQYGIMIFTFFPVFLGTGFSLSRED